MYLDLHQKLSSDYTSIIIICCNSQVRNDGQQEARVWEEANPPDS